MITQTPYRIPTVSVIIPSSDSETDLQNTLKNIRRQTYPNYECIVVERKNDFLSTLGSGLSSAKGGYIFYCPAGDGYWHHNWFSSCLEELENNPRLSLVWGLSQNLLPDGAPGRIDQANYQYNNFPLRGKKHIYYWLKKKNFFPLNTLCVRKEVLERYLSLNDNSQTADTEFENCLNFSLYFNVSGYLPVFIPETAGYHRYKDDRQKKKDLESLNDYKNKIDNYKYRLTFGKASHHFRDSSNNVLSGKFYLSIFLFYDLAKKFKSKLPRPLKLYVNIIRQMIKKVINIRLA